MNRFGFKYARVVLVPIVGMSLLLAACGGYRVQQMTPKHVIQEAASNDECSLPDAVTATTLVDAEVLSVAVSMTSPQPQ